MYRNRSFADVLRGAVIAEDLDRLLDDLEAGLEAVDALPDRVREDVLQLLDGVDALHRSAITRIGELLGPEGLGALRADPLVAWLFDVYHVGVDQLADARRGLDEVRPYIESHGGEVELLDATAGVVRVRLSGACAGCTASAETLRERIAEAMRRHVSGFVAVEAEEDDEAEPHPPPVGPVPVELTRDPNRSTGPPPSSPSA